MPAEVVQQPADVRAVGELLVLRLRLLGVRAGEHPVPVALGEHRRLEVGLAEGARVVHRLGELERALDVLARRLVVALAAVAARAPREDVQRAAGRTAAPSARRATSASSKSPTAVEMLESMYRQTPRRYSTSARSMSENSSPSTSARASPSSASARLDVAGLRARHRLAVQRAHLQLDGAGAEHGRQRLACTRRSRRRTRAPRAARRRGRGSPRPSRARRRRRRSRGSRRRRRAARASHSIVSARRARLAALDLRDVLLREPVAGEVGLRQAGGDAQLAQALAEARSLPRCWQAVARCVLPRAAREVIGQAKHAGHLTETQSPVWDMSPKRGIVTGKIRSSKRNLRIT